MKLTVARENGQWLHPQSLKVEQLYLFIGTNPCREHAADLWRAVTFISSPYDISKHQTLQNFEPLQKGG